MFRGSHPVPAGLVTTGRLRGPSFRRVFPDVFVRHTKHDIAEDRARIVREVRAALAHSVA